MHHGFLPLHKDETTKVEWCRFCGCVRTEEVGKATVVFFPVAYEKVSQTTCAKTQEALREAGKL